MLARRGILAFPCEVSSWNVSDIRKPGHLSSHSGGRGKQAAQEYGESCGSSAHATHKDRSP